jgi:hypothetical protein
VRRRFISRRCDVYQGVQNDLVPDYKRAWASRDLIHEPAQGELILGECGCSLRLRGVYNVKLRRISRIQQWSIRTFTHTQSKLEVSLTYQNPLRCRFSCEMITLRYGQYLFDEMQNERGKLCPMAERLRRRPLKKLAA